MSFAFNRKAGPGTLAWSDQGPFAELVRPWNLEPALRRKETAEGRLRVMFIGFSDQRGGAAIASSRLIRALEREGNVATLEVVAHQQSDAPWTLSIGDAHRSPPWFVLNRLAAFRNIARSDPYGWLPMHTAFLRRAVSAFEPDIVHLHNLHGGLGTMPLPFLAELARSAPLVWTLHDMWAATGHCAYALECERWRQGCGDCPDLSLYPPIADDRTASLAKTKRAIFREAEPVLVTPSRWLSSVMREAFPTKGLDCRVIPNGVDLDLFHPRRRMATRDALGVEEGAPLIMFGAESLSGDQRKGGRELRSALTRLQAGRSAAPLDILLMGNGGDDLMRGIEGLRVHQAGFVTDEAVAADLYAAADLFVCPSLQDNLPNTLLEASAAGTACITFDAGGCAETIEPGVTGCVIPKADHSALANTIADLTDNVPRLRTMGAAARERAEAKYGDQRMASDYNALYRELKRACTR